MKKRGWRSSINRSEQHKKYDKLNERYAKTEYLK